MSRNRVPRPAPDGSFAPGKARVAGPAAMDTDHYVYGVVPVDGRDARALFCAGDVAGARELLGRDPNLVNAQRDGDSDQLRELLAP